MPSKFSDNQGRRIVAGRKIKQVWRPKPPPPPPSPPWTELPCDITANILHRLGAVEILETAQKVCTTWRSVCKDPAMWRVIDMHPHIDDANDWDLIYGRLLVKKMKKMCLQAVDRSQGQLVEINVEYLADNELLDYIAARSGNLRRLRLFRRYSKLSIGCLTEAIKRFPKLESLDLSDISKFSSETIEMVGRSCPLLSSFAIKKVEYKNDSSDPNKTIYGFTSETDEEAFAIARSMPQLRRLQLLEYSLTNKGLEAILDGCPHLESLDLCRCFHLKLEGSALEKRLSSQLKCLKHSECSIPKYYAHYSYYDE